MANSKRLYRSETDRMLGGVCGGIAETYDMDPTLIRLITALLILSGLTPIAYLLAWIIIPTESEVKNHKKVKDVDAEKVEENSDNEEGSEEE